MLESRIQPNDDVGAGPSGRGITASGSTWGRVPKRPTLPSMRYTPSLSASQCAIKLPFLLGKG